VSLWGVRRLRADEPTLITDAKMSAEAEYQSRRRRYGIMMALRVVCVIGAACVYQVSLWAALALVAGSAVLPWCAVLIANDGPAKKRAKRRDHVVPPMERTLPAPGDESRTIEG
jgi:Flp pilus assembly protein TadB